MGEGEWGTGVKSFAVSIMNRLNTTILFFFKFCRFRFSSLFIIFEDLYLLRWCGGGDWVWESSKTLLWLINVSQEASGSVVRHYPIVRTSH